VNHYHLPMDSVDDDGFISNPSSLHAVFHWRRSPAEGATHGVQGHALRLDGINSYVSVDTSALMMECFGNPNKCTMGKYSYRSIDSNK